MLLDEQFAVRLESLTYLYCRRIKRGLYLWSSLTELPRDD